ncbi:lytic transglycosylase domain-containing protein [Pedobacter glucosidilyticus]|uniref:lytic transglycosylase domain-containing protein n=1 Tax=Pedobacter glucosidilyticus TaxID=1122941 RepID=UPI0003FF0887|nr:lytic transglycosylase domain-containing protein [Pedobacter glucosidilyticus]
MRSIKSLILCIIFLSTAQAKSQNLIKTDTSRTLLTPKESRTIRNLVRTDSSFVPTQLPLQLELLKYNANLLYKYRLDSIKTPISLDYNQQVQTYIDIFLGQRKFMVSKMLSLGNYYFPIFEKALKTKQIPEEFKFLPIIESSLDPHAVSRSGATGLWQFTYITGKGYGLTIDSYLDERKDPISSSYAAANYLKDAYKDLGDWLLTLAAYNCGTGCVKRAIQSAGGARNYWEIQPYLPVETQNYVPKFIAVTYLMNYYHTYKDIKIPDADAKINIDSIYVNKFVGINDLAAVLDMEEKDLQILNPAYKRNIINGSETSPKRLIIPKVSFKTYASLYDILNNDKSFVELAENPVLMQASQSLGYHIVAKGETLTSIANKYRLEAQDLKVWNNLKNFSVVPGQKIIITKENEDIPKPQFLTYTVKLGDTLTAIAKKFNGATVSSIQTLNNLQNANLSVGMVLKIMAL